jgi:hypothetical protein
LPGPWLSTRSPYPAAADRDRPPGSFVRKTETGSRVGGAGARA